jgi:hypothetical protein
MTFENTGNATIDLVHSLTGELVQKKKQQKKQATEDLVHNPAGELVQNLWGKNSETSLTI